MLRIWTHLSKKANYLIVSSCSLSRLVDAQLTESVQAMAIPLPVHGLIIFLLVVYILLRLFDYSLRIAQLRRAPS
jgi:hypothetical protein